MILVLQNDDDNGDDNGDDDRDNCDDYNNNIDKMIRQKRQYIENYMSNV